MRRGDFSTASRLLDDWVESDGRRAAAGARSTTVAARCSPSGRGTPDGAAALGGSRDARPHGARASAGQELASRRALGVAALLAHDADGAAEQPSSRLEPHATGGRRGSWRASRRARPGRGTAAGRRARRGTCGHRGAARARGAPVAPVGRARPRAAATRWCAWQSPCTTRRPRPRRRGRLRLRRARPPLRHGTVAARPRPRAAAAPQVGSGAGSARGRCRGRSTRSAPTGGPTPRARSSAASARADRGRRAS